MRRDRVNDVPKNETYLSRARQAIEEGMDANDEVGDKQAGDGYIQVPIESLHKGLDIVRELKSGTLNQDEGSGRLDELESILQDIIMD